MVKRDLRLTNQHPSLMGFVRSEEDIVDEGQLARNALFISLKAGENSLLV